jgi:hypothetical protein
VASERCQRTVNEAIAYLTREVDEALRRSVTYLANADDDVREAQLVARHGGMAAAADAMATAAYAITAAGQARHSATLMSQRAQQVRGLSEYMAESLRIAERAAREALSVS